MAQNRWWNYKDDDSTFRLIQWMYGILTAGRYRGFGATTDNTLNLTIVQQAPDAFIQVSEDALTTTEVGLWISPQGTVVKEDASFVLPISAGDATFDRIDIIVGQHKYDGALVGGTTAIYSVIEGTPSATPVAPALTIPNEQTILGYLLVPATSTQTDQMTYTQAAIPDFSEDTTIAHLDVENIWSALQNFTATAKCIGDIPGINGANQLVLADELACDAYVISAVLTGRTTLNGIVTPTGAVPTPSVGYVRSVKIFTPYELFLSATFVGEEIYVPANTHFELQLDSSGTWLFVRGDEYRISEVTKAQKMLILKALPIGNVYLDAAGQLSLPNLGNVIYLNNTGVNNTLNRIQRSTTYTPNDTDGGMVLHLIPNSAQDLLITPFDFTGAPTYKPIWTNSNVPVTHRGGTMLTLVEGATYWRVVSMQAGYKDWALSITNILGGGTATLGSFTARFQVVENAIEVEIEAGVTIASTVESFEWNLPSGYLPSLIGKLLTGVGISASLRIPLYITVQSGGQLLIQPSGANFTVGTYRMSLTARFELVT